MELVKNVLRCGIEQLLHVFLHVEQAKRLTELSVKLREVCNTARIIMHPVQTLSARHLLVLGHILMFLLPIHNFASHYAEITKGLPMEFVQLVRKECFGIEIQPLALPVVLRHKESTEQYARLWVHQLVTCTT